MAYELPPLPYPYDALEPYIDARTMEIHHTKHHQAYINNVNAALEQHPDLARKPIDQLLREINQVPESIRQTVINHGGGHANHSLFWLIMGPKKGGEPRGDLATAINEAFGSFANFKEQFSKAAINRFGSGWAWLVLDQNRRLAVYSTANQDSPLMQGHLPILGLDVWEHAYYLKYQNRRPDYVAAWWNVVNWDKVAEYFAQFRKS
jgi:Fe-Mn family superoxide dismutase